MPAKSKRPLKAKLITAYEASWRELRQDLEFKRELLKLQAAIDRAFLALGRKR